MLLLLIATAINIPLMLLATGWREATYPKLPSSRTIKWAATDHLMSNVELQSRLLSKHTAVYRGTADICTQWPHADSLSSLCA